MGFRSTIISQEHGLLIPDWFVEKYNKYFHIDFTERYGHTWFQPISSKLETKFYEVFKEQELFVDIQKIMIDTNFQSTMSIVLLHECGGITVVNINKDYIKGKEPTGWKEVEQVEHNYCYGCSKLPTE